LAALAIARILKLPIYGTYHTALPQYAQILTGDTSIEELMWKYVIWYYDQMDIIFAPSQSTADELIQKGIAAEKIRLYPRGIDIEVFHPAKRNGIMGDKYGMDNAIKLLYVGRISKEKNLAVLEAAFRKLVERESGRVSLVVVGDGPYLQEMQAGMAGLPCVFTGYLSGETLASVYASCDLFIFPSTTDTFGNVVLEALASGVPAVVTGSGGPKYLVRGGITGFVAGDEAGFLKCIVALAKSQELRERMGVRARDFALCRYWNRIFDRVYDSYEYCLRSRRAAPFRPPVFA